MSKERRDEQKGSCPHSYVYWMPGEKEEKGNDLVDPKSRRSGGGEWEEVSSWARILSLPRSSVFEHGKEKEKRRRVLGNDGSPISIGGRFFRRGKRFEIEEGGNDKK